MKSSHSKRARSGAPSIDPRQQDLFASETFQAEAPTPPTLKAATSPPPPVMTPALEQLPKLKRKARQTSQKLRPPPLAFGAEDWWTTRSVCAFLKIGRKALWNMRRDPASDFPAPVDAVGHRHLYLASEVRAWMEAQREAASRRAHDRRKVLTQFY